MPKPSPKILAIDTETTGLDIVHGARPFYVSACWQDGQTFAVEWKVNPETREVEIDRDDVNAIQALIDRAPKLILHNAKFDVGALRSVGVILPWDKIEDSLVGGHVLASSHSHTLDAMAVEYLGRDITKPEKKLKEKVMECRKKVQQAQLRLKRHGDNPSGLAYYRIAEKGLTEMPSASGEEPWRFDYWLPKALNPNSTELEVYANQDPEITLLVWQVVESELKRKGLWDIYRHKMESIPALDKAEVYGVSISLCRLESLAEEYRVESKELSAKCVDIARENLYDLQMPRGSSNNGSLISFCFDVLKLPVIKRTPTEKPSLDKEVIEEYKKVLDGQQRDFIKALAGQRKRNKSLEALYAYQTFGMWNESDWLRLHCSHNPCGTATTRLSCNSPNLQQASKQESMCEECHGEGCPECGHTGEDLHSIRKVFGPMEGREWWTADAENIELRIPAYKSGQKELIALFERPNDPPFYGSQHLLNFSVVYPDLWEDAVRQVGFEKAGPWVKKTYAASWYQWCKNGDFAIQYQCGRATADRTFHRAGSFDRLKSKFTALEDLNQRCVKHAEQYGYVETLCRNDAKRGYPLLCARGDFGRVLSTTPLNYMTQGSAGEWMTSAINRCEGRLSEWRGQGFDAWMIMTVHDELVFDFPKRGHPMEDPRNSNLIRAYELKGLMELGGEDINVPTPVALKWCPESWASGISV